MQTAEQVQSRPFEVGRCAVSTSIRPNAIELRWTGWSDERHADRLLRTYFGACVSRAISQPAGIELHLDQLEFANSSSIGALIHLISLTHQHRVPLTLTYSSARRWQVLCVRAMHWAASNPLTRFVDSASSSVRSA